MTSRVERVGMGLGALFCATYGPWSVWGDRISSDGLYGLAGGLLAGVVAGGVSGVASARARRRKEREAHPLHEAGREPRSPYDGPLALLPDYPPATPGQLARPVGVAVLVEPRIDPVTLERAAALGFGGAMHADSDTVSHSVGMLPDCHGCAQLLANAKRDLIARRSTFSDGGRV